MANISNIKKLLNKNEIQEAINTNNFTRLYEILNDGTLDEESIIGNLTQMFYKVGIDPLKYMNEIPTNFLCDSDITKFIIPKNILKIGENAFISSKLESINIPDNVITIGRGAFDGCNNLKNIKFNNNLKAIPDMLCNNTALEEVILPDSIDMIGIMAFCSCKYLKKIILPKGLQYMSNRVFSGCKNLTEIFIPKSVKFISTVSFY